MYEHQEVKLKMQLDVLYVIDCSFYNIWKIGLRNVRKVLFNLSKRNAVKQRCFQNERNETFLH